MRIPRRPRRRATLRVTAPESDGPRDFEALVLLGGRRPVPLRFNAQTPFERELPDDDLTIVVSAADLGTPLAVEYVVARGSRVVLAGRSWWPIAVIQRRRRRVVAGGIHGPFGEDGAGSQAALRGM